MQRTTGQQEGQPRPLKISGVRALGELLGIGKTAAAEMSHEPWFPRKGVDGTWSTVEVLAAVEARKTSTAPAGGAPSAADSDLVRILEMSTDATAVAHASVILAARVLARAHATGELEAIGSGTRTVSRALEELRRTEADRLELGVRQGGLIDRDVAKSVVGELARDVKNALRSLVTSLAGQYAVWHRDEAFNAQAPDARDRAIFAWTEQQTDQARLGETEEAKLGEIERRLAAEVERRSKKREVA